MAAEWYLAAKQKPQSCLNSTAIFFSVCLCAGAESPCWMVESWPSPLYFCSDQIRFQITASLFLLVIYGCGLRLVIHRAVYLENWLHAWPTLRVWKVFDAESKCRGRSWWLESGSCAFSPKGVQPDLQRLQIYVGPWEVQRSGLLKGHPPPSSLHWIFASDSVFLSW